MVNVILEDLERRKENLEIVIEIAKEELYHIMKKIKEIENPRKIGFRINQNKDDKRGDSTD